MTVTQINLDERYMPKNTIDSKLADKLDTSTHNTHASTIASSNTSGHVKVITDISDVESGNGEALSAYAGRLIQEKINELETILESLDDMDPVAINAAITRLQNITTTTNVSQNSSALVTSGAVFNTKQALENRIDAIENGSLVIDTSYNSLDELKELEEEDIKKNKIYIIPSLDADDNNIYDEYIYKNDDWELIGSRNVDLSNLANASDVESLNNQISTAIGDVSFENGILTFINVGEE